MIYLPRNLILIISCVLIFGHNLLDTIHFKESIIWSLLHEPGPLTKASDGIIWFVAYPIIPWIAVMSLGYFLGLLYDKSFDGAKRKNILKIIGFSSIGLFLLLNYLNIYGDTYKWKHYENSLQTIMSFFNPNKYPPSLMYLLMTLGPVFLLLAYSEKIKGKVVNFFSVFGRVPFFYYIIHLYVIHFIALLVAEFTGFGWEKMILHDWLTELPELKGFGFSLVVVYVIWIFIIAMLYPICKWFDEYKMKHKDKWWLSYL